MEVWQVRLIASVAALAGGVAAAPEESVHEAFLIGDAHALLVLLADLVLRDAAAAAL